MDHGYQPTAQEREARVREQSHYGSSGPNWGDHSTNDDPKNSGGGVGGIVVLALLGWMAMQSTGSSSESASTPCGDNTPASTDVTPSVYGGAGPIDLRPVEGSPALSCGTIVSGDTVLLGGADDRGWQRVFDHHTRFLLGRIQVQGDSARDSLFRAVVGERDQLGAAHDSWPASDSAGAARLHPSVESARDQVLETLLGRWRGEAGGPLANASLLVSFESDGSCVGFFEYDLPEGGVMQEVRITNIGGMRISLEGEQPFWIAPRDSVGQSLDRLRLVLAISADSMRLSVSDDVSGIPSKLSLTRAPDH